MKKQNIETLIKDALENSNISEADKVDIMSELESKDVINVAGDILEISNSKDGVSCIQIRDLDGLEHMLCHPGDMTDDQLSEFKRAQNHALKVEIFYCNRAGDKDLIDVSVKSS